MKYTALGNSGIKVSKLCLGCMGFGRPNPNFLTWTDADEKNSQKVVAKALELGINYFDTANIYTNGDSELYLGKALKNLGVKRDEVFIQTKVFFNEGKLSKEAIKREIEGSLKRLDMDYVDVYMIHRFDYDHDIFETMSALDELVKAGKVRALGASAMYGYQFFNMQLLAKNENLSQFSVMQNHYNLIYREDERELIPVCKQFGTSIAPYSPLAGGHLSHEAWQSGSKRSQEDSVLKAKYDASKTADLKIIERVASLAKKRGVSMTQIALAWLFAKGVHSPVLGAIKCEHVEEWIGALDIALSSDELSFLEELYIPHKVVGAIDKGGPERIERK